MTGKCINAAGLSQEEAARLIGVSLQTVGRWERGERQPKAVDHQRALEVYGVRLQNGRDRNVPRDTAKSDRHVPGSETERLYLLGAALARAGATRAEVAAAISAIEALDHPRPSDGLPREEEHEYTPTKARATRRGKG